MRSAISKGIPISLVLAAYLAGACGPGEPPVSPNEYEPARALNPLHNGKTVYRSYGDHHPTCFVLNKSGSGETETSEVPCPEGFAVMAESCPAGKLHRRLKGSGCICAPIDGEPTRVECAAN